MHEKKHLLKGAIISERNLHIGAKSKIKLFDDRTATLYIRNREVYL